MFGALLTVGAMFIGQTDAGAGLSLERQVRGLVRQLNSKQLAERDAAEAKLIGLGPKVLDLLPRPTPRTPIEVKQRLGRIRHKLQQTAAEFSVRASTVTLKGKAVPLSQILASIEQQTGNKITDIRKRFGHEVIDPKLDVEFEKTPFWQALDRVLDQAELTVYPHPVEEEKAVFLVARGETRRPRSEGVAYAGPFRLEPQKIMASRDLRDPGQKALMFQLEVAWEPRLAPITLKQKLGELHATDEDGKPVAVADNEGEIEVPGGKDSAATNLILPWQLPPRNVEKIAKLTGKFTATVPGKIETFTFDDLGAKNVKKRIAGVTVILEEVRKNNQLQEVRIRVQFDSAGKALASHRNWIFNNEAYLVDSKDEKGEKVEYETLETTRQAPNEVGVAYLFFLEKPIGDYKFVYKTAGVIVATEFEYELKDIKLP